MLDPCNGCRRPECRLRKADCLAPYANLRAIGNSAGGFARARAWETMLWSPAEISFYNAQIHHIYGRQTLPPIL